MSAVRQGPGAPRERAHPDAAAPLLRVVRGEPTAEDLAALVAVLTARGGGAPQPPPTRSLWGRPRLRGPLHPGPGAWRAGALPT